MRRRARLNLWLIGCMPLASCAAHVDTAKSGAEGGAGVDAGRPPGNAGAAPDNPGGPQGDAGGPQAAVVASNPRSGTRLRARITDAGDGARRFDGWYDAKLETSCTFGLATDGVRRCIPLADTVSGGPDYSDPACTAPVLSWADPKRVPAFFASEASRFEPTNACMDVPISPTLTSGVLVTSWRIGPAEAAPSRFYHRDASGCAPRPTDANVTVVYPLSEIAPSELVAVATTRLEPRGASLATEVLENEDGSSMSGDIFDVALKHWCFPSWADGVIDDYRCYGATYHTGDSAPRCGAPESCDNDTFVDDIDFCTPVTFHRSSKTACEVFDAAEFPMLDSAWLGTGRVRLVVTHPADDARALSVNPNLWQSIGRYKRGPFFDTERQLTCDPTLLEDGTVRCLTQDVVSADLYADAACTTLIAENPPGNDPCPTHLPSPAPAYAVSHPPARLYKLGTRVHRDQVYWWDPSSSPAVCAVLPSGSIDAYDLTPADTNLFATLKIETE